jgi:outer membrane protein assembly factor BamB
MVSVTDTMIYAAAVGGDLLAFDAHTHALIWHEPFDTEDILVASDRLYLDYGAVNAVAALNAMSGTPLWRNNSDVGLTGVRDGVLYGVGWSGDGKKGTIYAFNTNTGSLLWTMSTGVPILQWGGMTVA